MRKPFVERIDSFSGKAIIYRCSCCGTSFALLGDKILYCYHCGEQVDWGVLKELPCKISELPDYDTASSDKFESTLVDSLNESQLGDEFLELYHDDGAPKKCEECKFCCQDEFCTFPDEDKNIIFIPRRAGFCHSAICDKYTSK